MQEIHPRLCRKGVSVQKYNALKSQLFAKQVQLEYVEGLRKETEQRCEQRCDEARVDCIKAQQQRDEALQQRDEARQHARHYEVQFQQNLKPQFDAKEQENVQQKEQIEALKREVAQLREQLGEMFCGLQGWSGLLSWFCFVSVRKCRG